MSTFGRSRRCTHIKVTGHRCGSPALRGENFCYFHALIMQRISARVHHAISPIALVESEEAIQVSLITVIDSILKGTIELKRAQLILRALSIAERNARRSRIGYNASDMVRHLPEQAIPTESPTLDAATDAACHSERSEEPAPGRHRPAADSDAPLTDQQLEAQRALHDFECKLENALRGDLRDAQTVFEAAGLLDADGHL